MEDPVYQTGIN